MDEEKKKSVKSSGTKKTVKKGTTTAKKTTGKSTNKSAGTKKRSTANKKAVVNKPKKVSSSSVVKSEEVKEEKKVVKEEVVSEPIVKKVEVHEEKEDKVVVNNNISLISLVVMVLLMLILFASMYSNSLFNKYSSSWDGKSYLVEKSHVHQIKCDEIPNAVTGSQSFILVTDAQGEEEYNLEKKLSKVISERGIKNDFYVYVLNDNCGPVSSGSSIASTNLQLIDGLDKVPTIIYYRNGVYMDRVVRSDKQMINDGDFAQLLDMYEIK